MLCYGDKTFCSFWEDCECGSICYRALTEEVWHNAEVMKLPISQFVDRPECFEELKIKKENDQNEC